MNKLKWKTIEAKDHCLEMAYTDKGTGIVTEGGIKPIWNHRVICKWDGCVDYSTYSNGYGYDHECNDNCQCCQDYIHICDLEKHIEEMQEILKKAKEHYGEDWGNL